MPVPGDDFSFIIYCIGVAIARRLAIAKSREKMLLPDVYIIIYL